MSEAVDYVALLTAVPSVLVVGDESFEFSLGLAEAAAAVEEAADSRAPPFSACA